MVQQWSRRHHHRLEPNQTDQHFTAAFRDQPLLQDDSALLQSLLPHRLSIPQSLVSLLNLPRFSPDPHRQLGSIFPDPLHLRRPCGSRSTTVRSPSTRSRETSRFRTRRRRVCVLLRRIQAPSAVVYTRTSVIVISSIVIRCRIVRIG
ncbi:unnamed protein product [Camellia sinensis]